MLEANNSHTKKANEAIVNYLTNVGGKLVSINEKKFTEKKFYKSNTSNYR